MAQQHLPRQLVTATDHHSQLQLAPLLDRPLLLVPLLVLLLLLLPSVPDALHLLQATVTPGRLLLQGLAAPDRCFVLLLLLPPVLLLVRHASVPLAVRRVQQPALKPQRCHLLLQLLAALLHLHLLLL